MKRSNNKQKEMTAALYVRLSRDDNLEGDSYSIGNQKKLLTKMICTPKVRHFWRCIFLWQRKDKNIENTRQNSNYLL